MYTDHLTSSQKFKVDEKKKTSFLSPFILAFDENEDS